MDRWGDTGTHGAIYGGYGQPARSTTPHDARERVRDASRRVYQEGWRIDPAPELELVHFWRAILRVVTCAAALVPLGVALAFAWIPARVQGARYPRLLVSRDALDQIPEEPVSGLRLAESMDAVTSELSRPGYQDTGSFALAVFAGGRVRVISRPSKRRAPPRALPH